MDFDTTSVNPTDTPAFYRIRTEGVSFANGHAVFPTQAMPNAASIATGHLPGDTGQFANHLFVGYPLFDTGNFGRARGTLVPAVEEGSVLADINDHYGGNYLREASLLAYARSYGYNTATVGKTGPAALQDVADVSVDSPRAARSRYHHSRERDRNAGGIPLTATTMALLKSAGLRPQPPPRPPRWASAVVRRRRDEGDPSGVQQKCRAVRVGVLVGRGSDAARGDSKCRSQPEADSGLPRRPR